MRKQQTGEVAEVELTRVAIDAEQRDMLRYFDKLKQVAVQASLFPEVMARISDFEGAWEIKMLADFQHREAIIQRWKYVREQVHTHLVELEGAYLSKADSPRTQFSSRGDPSGRIHLHARGSSSSSSAHDREALALIRQQWAKIQALTDDNEALLRNYRVLEKERDEAMGDFIGSKDMIEDLRTALAQAHATNDMAALQSAWESEAQPGTLQSRRSRASGDHSIILHRSHERAMLVSLHGSLEQDMILKIPDTECLDMELQAVEAEAVAGMTTAQLQKARQDFRECEECKQEALGRLNMLEQQLDDMRKQHEAERASTEEAKRQLLLQKEKFEQQLEMLEQQLDDLRLQHEAERANAEEAKQRLLLQEEQLRVSEEDRRKVVMARALHRMQSRLLFRTFVGWFQNGAQHRMLCTRMTRNMQQAALRHCFQGFCLRVEKSIQQRRWASKIAARTRAISQSHTWNSWTDVVYLRRAEEAEAKTTRRADEAEGKLQDAETALRDAQARSAEAEEKAAKDKLVALEKSSQDLSAILAKLDAAERQVQAKAEQLDAADAARDRALEELATLRKEADAVRQDQALATLSKQLAEARRECDDARRLAKDAERQLEEASIQARSVETERDVAMVQLAAATDALEELAHHLPAE